MGWEKASTNRRVLTANDEDEYIEMCRAILVKKPTYKRQSHLLRHLQQKRTRGGLRGGARARRLLRARHQWRTESGGSSARVLRMAKLHRYLLAKLDQHLIQSRCTYISSLPTSGRSFGAATRTEGGGRPVISAVPFGVGPGWSR
jgi:hypothetical protein